MYFTVMQIADSTTVVRQFRHYLSLAEHGECVRIQKHGRSVARLVPDSDFMSGKQAADLFRSHKADKLERAAAQAIETEIARLDREADDALAH
jgi:antitoxin (DNA-binding transcriptional repressor) of toxin-antitoxin stability system